MGCEREKIELVGWIASGKGRVERGGWSPRTKTIGERLGLRKAERVIADSEDGPPVGLKFDTEMRTLDDFDLGA